MTIAEEEGGFASSILLFGETCKMTIKRYMGSKQIPSNCCNRFVGHKPSICLPNDKIIFNRIPSNKALLKITMLTVLHMCIPDVHRPKPAHVHLKWMTFEKSCLTCVARGIDKGFLFFFFLFHYQLLLRTNRYYFKDLVLQVTSCI